MDVIHYGWAGRMQKCINKASAHLGSSEPSCQEGNISPLACIVHLLLIKIHVLGRYEKEKDEGWRNMRDKADWLKINLQVLLFNIQHCYNSWQLIWEPLPHRKNLDGNFPPVCSDSPWPVWGGKNAWNKTENKSNVALGLPQSRVTGRDSCDAKPKVIWYALIGTRALSVSFSPSAAPSQQPVLKLLMFGFVGALKATVFILEGLACVNIEPEGILTSCIAKNLKHVL